MFVFVPYGKEIWREFSISVLKTKDLGIVVFCLIIRFLMTMNFGSRGFWMKTFLLLSFPRVINGETHKLNNLHVSDFIVVLNIMNIRTKTKIFWISGWWTQKLWTIINVFVLKENWKITRKKGFPGIQNFWSNIRGVIMILRFGNPF